MANSQSVELTASGNRPTIEQEERRSIRACSSVESSLATRRISDLYALATRRISDLYALATRRISDLYALAIAVRVNSAWIDLPEHSVVGT
jgi:hypothetical protein